MSEHRCEARVDLSRGAIREYGICTALPVQQVAHYEPISQQWLCEAHAQEEDVLITLAELERLRRIEAAALRLYESIVRYGDDDTYEIDQPGWEDIAPLGAALEAQP